MRGTGFERKGFSLPRYRGKEGVVPVDGKASDYGFLGVEGDVKVRVYKTRGGEFLGDIEIGAWCPLRIEGDTRDRVLAALEALFGVLKTEENMGRTFFAAKR